MPLQLPFTRPSEGRNEHVLPSTTMTPDIRRDFLLPVAASLLRHGPLDLSRQLAILKHRGAALAISTESSKIRASYDPKTHRMSREGRSWLDAAEADA